MGLGSSDRQRSATIAAATDPLPVYHSAYAVAFSPDGEQIAATDYTAGALAVIDRSTGKLVKRIPLEGKVTGLAYSADGRHIYAAEFEQRRVAEIDIAQATVTRRFEVGPYPEGLATAPERRLLLVAEWGADQLRAIDLGTGETRAVMVAVRQPFRIAVSPDESRAMVSNVLPAGRATAEDYGAVVSLYDLATLSKQGDVKLPVGSSAVRGVAIGPEGKRGYVVHTLGRYHVPTSQVDRGWVNTNALSVIDLAEAECVATVLLDQPMRGAADPWGLAVSADGQRLCVGLSGRHELALIDLAKLDALIDSSDPSALANDLSALHRSKAIRWLAIEGQGPRGVAMSPDGQTIAAAVYFSGQVALIDTADGEAGYVSLGDQPPMTEVRMGERVFHDGGRCFQNWLSCATCHPGGRVDGLNWDLLNDGLGNPKNAKSLVWSDRTPPVMSRGVRDKMETAATAGFKYIQFTTPTDEELAATIAYLKSLEPMVSPYRKADGSLTEAAKRGKAIFHSPSTQCASCHTPPLYTNMRIIDVGTRQPMDQADAFDTPTLVELWRSGPYLHDGSAATLGDLLIERNPDDRHGKTSHLTDRQLNDLIAFLLSL